MSSKALLFFLFTGIVGLNNIKANDYCNVVLQVGIEILQAYDHSWSVFSVM